MKKTLLIMFVALVAMGLTFGCAGVMSPVSGTLYVGVKAPFTATGAAGGSAKMGTAKCSSILGIVAIGDCSIDTAAKNGNVSKIHHVDYDAKNYLGFYASFKTMVYGD